MLRVSGFSKIFMDPKPRTKNPVVLCSSMARILEEKQHGISKTELTMLETAWRLQLRSLSPKEGIRFRGLVLSRSP